MCWTGQISGGGHYPAQLRPQTVAGLLKRCGVGGITSVPEVENESPEAYTWELAWPLWFRTSEDRALGLTCFFLVPAGPLSVLGPGMEARPQVGTTVAFALNFMAFADVRWHPNPLSLSSSYFHAVPSLNSLPQFLASWSLSLF